MPPSIKKELRRLSAVELLIGFYEGSRETGAKLAEMVLWG